MCQPLQASCTSFYPALPNELLLSSCFLLCFILAAQKHTVALEGLEECSLHTVPRNLGLPAQMKPFQGGFPTMVSIPKLCVPASPQHDLLKLQLS